MTVKEIAKSLLLKGAHINKGEFYRQYHTFTLTQRIEEIRKEGWDVRSKIIPGRNGMVEYWLEPQEIQRIISVFEDEKQKLIEEIEYKAQKYQTRELIPEMENEMRMLLSLEAVEPRKDENEQLLIQDENIAPVEQNTAQTEEYEQMGIGLLGGRNYG